MALSDQFNYQVGDRVKNNLTQEDGRVIDIALLGRGTLLVTVSIFIAGVAAGNKTFIQKAGQISGLEWIKDSAATNVAVSKVAEVSHPIEGGTVSARVTALAQANEPSQRSVSALIKDRLRAWNPKLANPNDEEAFADAVFDRIRYLDEVRRAVYSKGRNIDLHMNYLTATGFKDSRGQWIGSYLTELVHNKSKASAEALRKGDRIRKILQRTGIPAELRTRHGTLIPEGVQTAWELAVHADQRIKGLSYTEGNPLWAEYAHIISNAVDLSPQRRKLNDALEALNDVVGELRQTQQELRSGSFRPGSDPGRFGIFGGRTEQEADAFSEHQLESTLFGKNRKSARQVLNKIDNRKPLNVADPGRPFFDSAGNVLRGNPVPLESHAVHLGVQGPFTSLKSDLKGEKLLVFGEIIPAATQTVHDRSPRGLRIGRGIDQWSRKRQEQGPSVGDVLEGPETILSRDIGARTRGVRGKPLRTRSFLGEDILQHGPHVPGGNQGTGGHFVGRIVQHKGLPYRVTAVDLVTRRATLEPLHSDVELQAPDFLNRPSTALTAVRDAGRQRAALPLQVDQIEAQARANAKFIADRIADRKTISIRGGLLGAAKETVQVPMDLLREYLAGPATFRNAETLRRAGMPVFKDTQALKAAGFTGASDFAAKATKFSQRFEAELRQRLKAHPVLTGTSGQFAEQKLEELVSGARVAVAEHLGVIRGSRSIQQIEEELLRVGVDRSAHFAFGDTQSVVAETFTELDRVNDIGELTESGFDRVSRLTARSQGVTPSAVARLSSAQFITEEELRQQVLSFSNDIQDLRWGKNAIEIQSRFRAVFGTQGIIKPEAALTEMERISEIDPQASRVLTLAKQADSIAQAIREGEIGSAEAQSQLRLFSRQLGLHRTSVDKDTRNAWELYQANLNDPRLGPTHPSTLMAQRAFIEKKAAHVESVEERHLRLLAAKRTEQASPLGVPITTANEASIVEAYQAALELPLEQQMNAIRSLGMRVTLVGDQPVGVVTGRSGEQFTLRSAQGGMVAVSETNPRLARFFGNANQSLELSLGELEKESAQGHVQVLEAAGTEIQKGLADAAKRASTESFVQQYVGEAPTTLPVFRSGNNVVGFLESDLLKSKSVIENAKEALSRKRALLFIDIESNRETNNITMFAARRLEYVDGTWKETAAPYQIATPELWTHEQITGSAASRIAKRNGYYSLVNEVVESSQQLAVKAAAIVGQNSDAIVIGHHIGFDVGKLTETLAGVDDAAHSVMIEAAKTRTTDTLLISQITHPGQRSYSLEALGANIPELPQKEAHLSDPDVTRNIEVFKQSAAQHEAATSILDTLEQTQLNPDSVLWFNGGKASLRGRAFKVAAVLDAQAASEAFFKQTGGNLGVGFGVALQPISFVTGKPEGPLELNYAQTPHGWAGAFAAHGEVHDAETSRALMEAKANDLARRRIRRVTSDSDSFTRLLAERERVGLANARGQGSEAFGEAQDQLIQRLHASESEAERDTLRRTHRYSETYLQDTRTQRALQMETPFFEEEVAKLHAPVVNWLESSLKSASPTELPQLREAANQVWTDYMAQVEHAAPFTQESVVPRTTVSIKVPALGSNPVALHTRDALSLRRSLRDKVMDVAQSIKGSREFNDLFAQSSQEDINRVRQLMENNKSILDSDLGAQIEQHIFERHLAPAIEEGLVKLSVGEETRGEIPLGVRPTNLNQAVETILARTGDIVRKSNETAENPLLARAIPADVLETIQKGIGVGGDLLTAAETSMAPENLRVAFHHNAPKSWTGKSFQDLVTTAAKSDALEQIQFTDRLKGIYKKMASPEQAQLGQVVRNTAPQWLDEITGVKKAEEILASASPVKDFNPGTVISAGMEVSERASENATALKGLGLVGLGIISVGVAILARKPQGSQTKSIEEDHHENVLHSTEAEIHHRKERVANQVPMVSRISVNISGNDTTGIDHNELVQSVHSSLGSFLGTQISRSTNIHDKRSRIDQDYLDRVGAQLLKNPTGVS